MRPRRLRFTVGNMMIAVAIVGLLIGLGIEGHRLMHRARSYRYRAVLHGLTEKRLLGDLARTETAIAQCTDPVAVRARWQNSGFAPEDLTLFRRDDRGLIRRAEALRRRIGFHARMKERFETAAQQPWLAVREYPVPEREP